ncbi:MAG TPA: serine/threonine-protein kinase, partial [Thermoanaerobaculia bacterium]|nr:serine/threonine-protein kinase [Thermoanaerobaculia bacterium]
MPESQSTPPGGPVLRTLVFLEPLDGSPESRLLFDRPLDAVRFCLSWHDAVQGRAAIHLGEVFSVTEGEGPARAAALRLLALARGGQTLLTRTAFDLARRAAVGEELGAGIEWRAHGAYQSPLDGQEIEVFEVGRSPLAPLSGIRAAKSQWRPEAGQTVPQRPHWVLERRLEGATFGEIWLTRHLKTRDRRVLRFCLDPEELPRLRRQLSFLREIRERLAGPSFIVRPVDSQLTEEPFFLESEHAGGDPLPLWAAARGGLAQVPLAVRLDLGTQLADAVAALHSLGIALGPLDPFNLLIVEKEDGAPRLLLAELSQCLV